MPSNDTTKIYFSCLVPETRCIMLNVNNNVDDDDDDNDDDDNDDDDDDDDDDD